MRDRTCEGTRQMKILSQGPVSLSICAHNLFLTLYQAPFLISVKLKFYSKSHQAIKINVLQHITYSAWGKSIWSGDHLKSSPNLWVIARVLTWYWRFHKTFGEMIEIFNKDSSSVARSYSLIIMISCWIWPLPLQISCTFKISMDADLIICHFISF